jgi:CRP/FNR family transcriptional regulator
MEMVNRERHNTCGECGFCDSGIPLLDGIPQAQRRSLLKSSPHLDMRAGDFLFYEGENVKAIWIIRRGTVKLTRSDFDGREQIVGIFSDSEAIWEGIFLKESVYPYSAVCMTDVSVCAVSMEDFGRLLSDPRTARSIITLLSQKLHDANTRNILLSTKSPAAKIAGMLIYHKERSQETHLSLKLQDIAASLNLRPETVSRKLREFERNGLTCRAGKGKIDILDFEGLHKVYEAGRSETDTGVE